MTSKRFREDVMTRAVNEEQTFKKACDAAYSAFSHLETFSGCDIGFRWINGRQTQEHAVRIHITQKLPLDALTRDDVFPNEIEGVPVDVIHAAYGAQRGLGALTDRHPILAGGMSIGRNDGGCGTIGAIVIDNQSGRPAILSNCHVLAGAQGKAGDAIVQPGMRHGGSAHDTVATLARWMLNRDGDAAIAHLTGARSWLPIQFQTQAQVGPARAPMLGETLLRQGRSETGAMARVDGIGIYRTRHEIAPGVWETRDTRGFRLVTEASQILQDDMRLQDGDSGSLWLGEHDSAAVGLHMAAGGPSKSQQTVAIACAMPAVLRSLDIRLATYDDLFREAEKSALDGNDPRGHAFDKFYAPVPDQVRPAPGPMGTGWHIGDRQPCPILDDPRDLPDYMPVDSMPPGLYPGMAHALDEADRTSSEIWQRLTESLLEEGYSLDLHLSPALRIRDVIDTDYPEYVLAGIIESSRHFRDCFDTQPTGSFYKSCVTLGQVCTKLAALKDDT
jgi:hypothetical protein